MCKLAAKKGPTLKIESKKILVVDDDEILLDALTQLLARLGYEVLGASNGYKGLNLFLQGQFDIVLTDFDMPGMDGITLAYHIKEIFPDTLVILMTGHDRASILEQMEYSKVDVALFKPFDVLEIMHIIQPMQSQPPKKVANAL